MENQSKNSPKTLFPHKLVDYFFKLSYYVPMGMYNEVYKSCPECGKRCEIQIHQIVLGFGQFDLDNPDSLAEQLDEDQLLELKEAVNEEKFWCNSEGGCDAYFGASNHMEIRESRRALARKLFGE